MLGIMFVDGFMPIEMISEVDSNLTGLTIAVISLSS